jgi:UDP-N-acetylglucosamine--N-acetylmuramyl-(pentapeptide) pyrophosphoryl-undecaprenol N-acetylglucosamine transferase
MVDAGGGLLVEDAELSPAWIEEQLVPLLADADRLAGYARKAEAAGVPDADERLAGIVLEVARG